MGLKLGSIMPLLSVKPGRQMLYQMSYADLASNIIILKYIFTVFLDLYLVSRLVYKQYL